MATRPVPSSGAQVWSPAVQALRSANDNALGATFPIDTEWKRHASALPADAFAIIEPDPIGARSGGRAREHRWRLRFRERSRPFVDPLTGWTGGCDPLAQFSLQFPSRESAMRYCRRLGLPFEIRGPLSGARHALLNAGGGGIRYLNNARQGDDRRDN